MDARWDGSLTTVGPSLHHLIRAQQQRLRDRDPERRRRLWVDHHVELDHARVRPQNKSLLLALAIGHTVVGWSHQWDGMVSDSTCRTDARMKQASDLCWPVGLSISPESPTAAGSPYNISAIRLPCPWATRQ